MSSPALEDARIYDCDTLTNDVLQKAAKLNNFLNLRSLELTRCNAVSKDGIDVLMTDNNSLKLLDLFSRENVLDWNKQGFQKNWNLKCSLICVRILVYMMFNNAWIPCFNLFFSSLVSFLYTT